MSEEFELPSRPRVVDLLRPGRLFAGLAVHPTFVAATLLFVLCVVAYTLTALGPALPRLGHLPPPLPLIAPRGWLVGWLGSARAALGILLPAGGG